MKRIEPMNSNSALLSRFLCFKSGYSKDNSFYSTHSKDRASVCLFRHFLARSFCVLETIVRSHGGCAMFYRPLSGICLQKVSHSECLTRESFKILV